MALRTIQTDVRRVTMGGTIGVIVASGAVFIVIWWITGREGDQE